MKDVKVESPEFDDNLYPESNLDWFKPLKELLNLKIMMMKRRSS